MIMPVIDDSLVLYLHGACGKNSPPTTTWKDLSGHGNDARLSNFGYVAGSGWENEGIASDGVNDVIYLNYSPSFNIREAITLSIWMKRTSIYDLKRDTFLLSRNPSWYFYDAYNSGSIRGDVYIDGIRKAGLTTFIPYDGNWYQATYTYDSYTGTATMYRNGVSFNTTTLSGLSNYLIDESTANFLGIGINTLGRTQILSNAYIYNRALTPEEVLQNYQAGREWTPQIGERIIVSSTKPIITVTTRKAIGTRTPAAYINPAISRVTRSASGTRTPTSEIATITAEATRAGKGNRLQVAHITPAVSITTRAGKGTRTPASHLPGIASLATRAGRGTRVPASHISPLASTAGRAFARVTRRPVAFVNPVISNMVLPQVNAYVSYQERPVMLSVQERQTLLSVQQREVKLEVE